MKKLVVMVSIYDSGEWIENRLNNLRQSTMWNDMEVWCVNANSPDPRDDTIPRKFPVKYVKLEERNTVYEAWNYIIENSKSKFITNANTDDLVAPQCYQKLIGAIEGQRQFGFAYCSWYSTHVANQHWNNLKKFDAKGGRPGQYAGNLDRGGVGHFPLWKRMLHTKFGMFDTSFQALSDADWWARCFHYGKFQFKWVQEPLALYLWRNGENLWNRKITPKEWQKYHAKVAEYKAGRLA